MKLLKLAVLTAVTLATTLLLTGDTPTLTAEEHIEPTLEIPTMVVPTTTGIMAGNEGRTLLPEPLEFPELKRG